MSLESSLREIKEDLEAIRDHTDDLKDWEGRHEERHTSEQELLASIVRALSDHEGNGSHSNGSVTIRSGSIVAVFAGAIIIIAEVIRSFAF